MQNEIEAAADDRHPLTKTLCTLLGLFSAATALVWVAMGAGIMGSPLFAIGILNKEFWFMSTQLILGPMPALALLSLLALTKGWFKYKHAYPLVVFYLIYIVSGFILL